MKFLLLLALFGCGVIKTQNEIISIDTDPSGIEVFDHDKKSKGLTPLFVEIEKNSEDPYFFKLPNGELSEGVPPKRFCDYKSGRPIFERKSREESPNFFTIINPLTYVEGGSFECISAVRAEVEIKPAPKKCKTLLAISPRSAYQRLSYDLIKEYEKRVFDKNKSDCDKFISPEVTDEYFNFLGLDHLDPPEDLLEMDYQKIFKIGHKFSATHLVFLNYVQEGITYRVTPKVFDIHRGTEVEGPLLERFTVDLDTGGTFLLGNFFLRSFRLVPNGVALEAKTDNTLRFEDSTGQKLSQTYDNFQFGLTLDDIQYPLEKWAFNFRLVPVLVITEWGKNMDIDVYGLTLDLKFYLHLPPGGVFILRGGIGGSYLNASYSAENYHKGTPSWLYKTGIEFYVFPSERIYLGLGYRRYFVPDNVIVLSGNSLTGNSNFFLEIGFFWPELRMAARKLL